MPYTTELVDPDHPLWVEILELLQRSGDWQWVSDQGLPRPDTLIIAALLDQTPIGHIAISIQPVPNLGETELLESFVRAFHVSPDWRRRGVGRTLQLAALELSRAQSCYQMRSWSSTDKLANYRLKLGLGFCFCPAFELHGGKQIDGGYFVQRLG